MATGILSTIRDRSRDAIYAVAGVGLGIKQAVNPLDAEFENGIGTHVTTTVDFRRILFWVAISLLVLVFAAITNPTETSFRSHLTSISFRRHLSDIEVDQDREPAPFRFANHVAISLRTPTLFYRSLFVFSLALTVAPAPPIYLSDPVPPSGRAKYPRQTHIIYFGFVGHWSALGEIPRWAEWAWGTVNKNKVKASLPGILELKDASARRTDLETLPLHTPAVAAALVAESRRGSIVNLMSTVPPSPPPLEDDIPPSPALIALKAELAAAQAVLADLESQLVTHDEAVSAAHSVLQAQLDEVRQRKKEDDAERQELKSKTKALEEQKRQAEAARREADKKLKSLESIRDGLQAKITSAREEIEDLRGNIELSEKNANIIQEEGEQYLEETREIVEEKLKVIEELEHSVASIEAHNEDLSQKVRQAEERLAQAIASSRLAPEEEMMLMAAAYEVAASANEEYMQHDNSTNQWASQAAAYLAEGLPSLDPNYTARPAPGYRHNSSHRNLTSLGSATGTGAGVGVSGGKQQGTLSGFDDFGPGASLGISALGNLGGSPTSVPNVVGNHNSGVVPSGININSRSLAAPRTTTPPPQPQLDDADDPGSPNGAMSASFTANLLPQGLFRSLEGDAASTIDGDDDEDDDDLVDRNGVINLDIPPSISATISSPIIPGNGSNNLHSVNGIGAGLVSGQTTTWGQAVSHSYAQPHRGHQGTPSPAHSASDSGDDRDRPSSRLVRHTPPHPNSLGGQLAVPASNRWTSVGVGASVTDPAFPLFHPTSSNDSLVSPFAPSDSEKRALKWGPLSKYRWGGSGATGGSNSTNAANTNSTAAAVGADGGLGELAANLKREYSSHGYNQSYPGLGYGYRSLSHQNSHAQGLTAEELFNRAGSGNSGLAPGRATSSARSSSVDLIHNRGDSGGLGSWLSSSSSRFGEGAGIGSGSFGQNNTTNNRGNNGSAFNGYGNNGWDKGVGAAGGVESGERSSLGLGRVSDDLRLGNGEGGDAQHEKKQFRFFSLRKPSGAGAAA